jgi:hypothetical protein
MPLKILETGFKATAGLNELTVTLNDGDILRFIKIYDNNRAWIVVNGLLVDTPTAGYTTYAHLLNVTTTPLKMGSWEGKLKIGNIFKYLRLKWFDCVINDDLFYQIGVEH